MLLGEIPVELFLSITGHLIEADKQALRITCRAFRRYIPLPQELVKIYGVENPFFSKDVMERRSFLPRLLKPGNVFAGRNLKVCCGCLKLSIPSRFPMDGLKIDDFDICGECLLDLFRPQLAIPGLEELNLARCHSCHWFEGGLSRLEFPTRGTGWEPYGESVVLCSNCIFDKLWAVVAKGHKFGHPTIGEYYMCVSCGAGGSDGEMHGECVDIDDFFEPERLDPLIPYRRICHACHCSNCWDDECPGWPEWALKEHRYHFYDFDPDGRCYECNRIHDEETKCFLVEGCDEDDYIALEYFPPAAGPHKRQTTLDAYFKKG